MAHFALTERHFRDPTESKLPLHPCKQTFYMLFQGDLQIFPKKKSSEF